MSQSPVEHEDALKVLQHAMEYEDNSDWDVHDSDFEESDDDYCTDWDSDDCRGILANIYIWDI